MTKDIILDANILQEDPTVVARANDTINLIIPGVVITQLERNELRQGTRRLTELIRKAAHEEAVSIVNPSEHRAKPHPHVDQKDMQLLDLALGLKKDGGLNPIIATQDQHLRRAAEAEGITLPCAGAEPFPGVV